MSIRKSLKTSILLMSIIPVILMAICSYLLATNRYSRISEANCANIAQKYGYGFSSQLEAQIIESTSLASANNIKSLLLEKINSPDILLNSTSAYYATVKESLSQIANNFGNQVEYFLYDIDGYLVVSSTDTMTSDWSEIMSETIDSYDDTTVISISKFTENSLDVVSPISVRDQIVGLIRCNISTSYFGTFLSSADNFIIDNNGNFLWGYDANSQPDQHFLSHISNQQDELLHNNTEYSNTFYDSTQYVYGYATIPQFHWIYVVKQDTSTYTNVVATLPIIFLILLTVVILIANWLSNHLAIKYTQPILMICDDMQKAAEGQLDIHIPIESNDEFGTLSTNFNNMLNIISTNYNEISKARRELEESQIQLQTNYHNMEHLAYTDTLTGLYNRTAFFKFAPEILSGNDGSLTTHAVIFIDLDGFKGINDSLGHDYGDLLLKCVSSQLAKYINPDDILARNGGDEFVILRNQVPSHDDLEQFLDKLVSIASTPFTLAEETAYITLSAGAAIFPQNGLSLNELMKNADIAMYRSKNSGKNSYTFFDSTMEDELNRKKELLDVLSFALEKKEVYLLYQAQANVFNGEIVGCEALMRLNSPSVGYVSPEEFIPIAEESGLIIELGEWALKEAFQLNKKLWDNGFKPIKISVNISSTQLRNDRLVRVIEQLASENALLLDFLEIELTESVLMSNFEQNLSIIYQIRDLGVKIALDDFGTGYSSFSYLTKIPIDTLKIDKSFIANICEKETEKYIAQSIITLAHHLGITVVAEGVETIEQLRILQQQTCDILQGYFFSKAVSEKEFMELVTINSSKQ